MRVTAFTGERIRVARQLAGISQADLAAAVGLGQSMISQVESGSREATEQLVERVAQATGTPTRFFEATSPDLPTGTLRFRKLATARQGETRRAKLLFDEVYRVVVTLVADAQLEPPSLPIQGRGHLTGDGIEGVADATRTALGLSDDKPVGHVTRLLERARVAVAPLVLPGLIDDEEDAVGHFGMSMWPSPDQPALVAHFPMHAGDRQRYTLAHELGHLVLHTRREPTSDPEDEANRFAGAFLFPRSRATEAFRQRILLSELAQLKARWGVSIQALIMRGSHLGLIDQPRKVSLFKQLSARGWRRHEPGQVHLEEPLLLWRLMVNRFGQPMSYSRAANSLGLHAMTLRTLAAAPSH